MEDRTGSSKKYVLAGVIGLVVLAGIVIAAVWLVRSRAPSTELANLPVRSIDERVLPVGSYADVVAASAPAVVTIRSERRVRAPRQHPFLEDFFGIPFGGAPAPRERIQRGLGSGVIVTPDGYILTNHHVIDGAEDIRIESTDKRVLSAKVVGSDPPSDLAVLKVNASNLPVLNMGNSDQVRVGDVVLALGNPLGIGQTVTAGIISAKGRYTGLSDGSFEDFLQTDAPINQGNSGGALVNTNADLIGINSQILSPTGGNIGIGFAIPSNMARSVMEQLIKSGAVRRGQLGVSIQPVTSELAESLGLKDPTGVIVSAVQPGSAAERAGVRQGDVIIAFNGQAVDDSNALRNRVATTEPGSEFTLTVIRGGEELQLTGKLGELSGNPAATVPPNDGGDSTGRRLGVTVQPLTPEIASQLGIDPATQGLVVVNVDPASPAEESGIQQGDVILEGNRRPVRSPQDLVSVIEQAGNRPLLLLINRRGQPIYLAVRTRS